MARHQARAAEERRRSSAGRRRPPRQPEAETASAAVYRVNHHEKRKPMTLDEAILEMDKTRDYLVYRDAETDRVTVLVRRRDGNFDLVEG